MSGLTNNPGLTSQFQLAAMWREADGDFPDSRVCSWHEVIGRFFKADEICMAALPHTGHRTVWVPPAAMAENRKMPVS
jgi:hypothetical protein